MSIEYAVFDRLSNSAEVNAIVNNRIYIDYMPDDSEAPAIVYQLISSITEPVLTHDTSIERTRLQFFLIGSSKTEIITLSEAVKDIFRRVNYTFLNDKVIDAIIENTTDMAADPKTNRVNRVIDIIFTHEAIT